MSRRSIGRTLRLALLSCLCPLGAVALADDPPAQPAPKSVEVKPIPPATIPDDPPPHEGAMIDIPLTAEPPDMIIVEVLEALPGRPITGERLVRPDGTISLGFYGEVHVRGLSLEQVKIKVVEHLKHYLDDDTLGLREFVVDEAQVEMPPPAEVPKVQDKAKVEKPKADPPPAEAKARKKARAISRKEAKRTQKPVARRTVEVQAQDPAVPVQRPAQEPVEVQVKGHFVDVPPSRSDRVFVDIVAHNSKVYYVQGDVGVPGRLASTGRETVLDAINYAGGLVPNADPDRIHLYRPAQGGKPTKDYKIDFRAIQKGDALANLQLFPGDRLIVGRKPGIEGGVAVAFDDEDRVRGIEGSLPAPPAAYLRSGVLLYNSSATELAGKYLKVANDYRDQLQPAEREQLDDYLARLRPAPSKPDDDESGDAP